MTKRTAWLGRGLAVGLVGGVLGLGGIVGESIAQDSMKKNDTMTTEGKTKAGDTMPPAGTKKSSDMKMTGDSKDDMKSDNAMKKDGKAMMKDDKMMEKKQ